MTLPADYVPGSVRGHIIELEKDKARLVRECERLAIDVSQLQDVIRKKDATIARLERTMADLRLKQRGQP